MDNKAVMMLAHYKKILEEKTFDEYDILGFLIFIRSHLPKARYQHIREFADLVAHRHRDRGVVMKSIEAAIQNGYQVEESRIRGYHGMDYETWRQEWIDLGEEFSIEIDSDIVLEISVCIFSLAQYSEYTSGDYFGKVEIFISKNSESSELALCTTEGKGDSGYICFAKCGPFSNMNQSFPIGRINNAIETYRENGLLHLRVGDMTIF